MRRPALRSLRRLAGVAVALGAGALGVTVGAQQLTQPATGSRMIVLLFDVSSMQQEDVERAADSGTKYVEESMANSDLVAIVTIGSRLNVLTDFTSNREELKARLGSLSGRAGGAEATSNDVRLGAIRTLCETLAPIQQKKAVLYFSSGVQRKGDDNGIAVREATNTCNRGNVSLYPVDARGLATAVAGGGPAPRSSGGQGLFTGAR